MFFPIYITFSQCEGESVRIVLQKILRYYPDFTESSPSLRILLETNPSEEVLVQFKTQSQLRSAVTNMDKMTSVIDIPADREVDLEPPTPDGSNGPGGGITLQ